MQRPQVGQFVHWYNDANKDNDPLAALVVAHISKDQLQLLCFFKSGGEPSVKRCVRHVTDDQLEKNIALRIRNGGWDWITFAEPQMQYADLDKPERAKSKKTIDAEEVIRLYTEGYSTDEIARKVRSRGISKSQVEEIVVSQAAV